MYIYIEKTKIMSVNVHKNRKLNCLKCRKEHNNHKNTKRTYKTVVIIHLKCYYSINK